MAGVIQGFRAGSEEGVELAEQAVLSADAAGVVEAHVRG